MTVFLIAYLIVGVLFMINDLYDLEGMKIIIEQPKWIYFIGCFMCILIWLPVVLIAMFRTQDGGNNRPGGPTPL